MGTPAIAADNLRKSCGEVVALDGISFSVPFGSRQWRPDPVAPSPFDLTPGDGRAAPHAHRWRGARVALRRSGPERQPRLTPRMSRRSPT